MMTENEAYARYCYDVTRRDFSNNLGSYEKEIQQTLINFWKSVEKKWHNVIQIRNPLKIMFTINTTLSY